MPNADICTQTFEITSETECWIQRNKSYQQQDPMLYQLLDSCYVIFLDFYPAKISTVMSSILFLVIESLVVLSPTVADLGLLLFQLRTH
jgi:hypothetical protein